MLVTIAGDDSEDSHAMHQTAHVIDRVLFLLSRNFTDDVADTGNVRLAAVDRGSGGRPDAFATAWRYEAEATKSVATIVVDTATDDARQRAEFCLHSITETPTDAFWNFVPPTAGTCHVTRNGSQVVAMFDTRNG